MLHQDVMHKRITQAKQFAIPMSNYGLFIAYYTGILEEASSFLI